MTKKNRILEFNTNAELYFKQPRSKILNKSYSFLCTESGKENILSLALKDKSKIYIGSDHIEWNIININNSLMNSDEYIVIGKGFNNKGIPTDDHTLQEYLNIWSNYIPGNIYWKGIDGVYLGCNDVFLKSFGFNSKNRLVGKTDYDLWGDNARNLIEHDKIVVESRRPHCFEETISLPSGIKQYFTVLKAPLINDTGNLIGIINNALSINEIKNALIKITLEKEKIETENKTISQYLQDIISAVPGSIYWKNKEGIYLGCNDFMAKTAGLSTSDIIGKSDYELWPSQASKLCENDKRVMDLGQSIRMEEEVTLSNGKKRFFIVDKMPLRDPNGKLNGIIGNSMEITDLKEIQAALESANNAKTEFIANMSHDIRTPLTGVVGMSKLLEDKVEDPNQKQYAQWLGESGAQLLNMLNVILDTVSAENVNETDLHEEPFNLNQVILDILQLERPSTLTKGINLKTHVDETIPPCLVSDHTKIHRILLNLLGNAIKFTQVGQIEIDVKLLKKSKTHVSLHFSVTDTGIGIPYDLQDKVFDKFFRVTPSYKGVYTGHGLGLHIAQSYANLLGGKIKLTSTPGAGTTFYFDLLLKIGDGLPHEVPSNDKMLDEIQPPSSSTDPIPTATELPANAPRLLLVEDNHIALLTLENIATQAGCRFSSAIDGESALNLAKTESFDLIITDLGLPGISGIDFTHQLREFEKEQHKKPIPIIGLTAHAENKIKKECLQSGMNAAFTKPMNPEILEKIKLTYLSSINFSSIKTKSAKTANSKKLGADLPDSEEELFKLEAFPLLNAKSALANMGNNAVLLNNILKSMVEQEIPNDIMELENAHRSNDWETIEKLAHRMKGGLVYCGTTKLVHACQYLERYRKAGHVKFLEPLYQQLCVVIEETKNAINEWLTR
ncbi:PAS domain-containing hybrid sensor histidine kinase/response regulator [Legionella maioricensis]|uniref:histidine kinase n=1 Tax=Legionella maioricensis TaxID=2896528 RepID=A0A9X2ID05_9GAMM|nr:ATP-binding protein [Legionella maioricensis]MCL9684278.1 PAS domain-containing protein [Legionella maioricensis]MCL9687144.1 ATP-binding protein [Legionella maioricensis]